MSDRLASAFARGRAEGRALFIPYLTAGDPSVDATVETVLELAAAGCDVIELGLPFSDPLADGPVNQAAAERALRAGATLAAVLAGVRRIRRESDVPLVMYSYLNPLLAAGFEPTVARVARAGIDGLLILDLAAEEAGPFDSVLRAHGVDRVRLVTPTSTDERLRLIVRGAGGFIYCVSRAGVTGARRRLSPEAASVLARARRFTPLPLALGFGISTAAQARQAARMADGVVVGSALVQRLHAAGGTGRAEVIGWARGMARAVHGARRAARRRAGR